MYPRSVFFRCLKEWIYNLNWFLLIFGIILYYSFLHNFKSFENELSFISILLAFGYFIHHQKLEEAKFFIDMFQRFNERFDCLNEELNEIMVTREELSKYQKNKVIDYFNLCSEEYLIFTKGYVPLRVWNSWKNGMKFYFKNPKIKMIYEEECRTNNIISYYGLNIELILKE